MKKFAFAAVLAGTALGGVAYAAQDAAAPAPQHRHHGSMLKQLDGNGDGVVTREEATAASDAMFAKMDPNGDGRITADEMKARRDAMRAKWAERHAAKQAGGAQTTDTATRKHHRPRHGMMGKRMDANGDGTITRDEARTAALARFDRMDANKDGRIDKAEVAALHAKMKAKRQANQDTGE
ncbi:MAG TPA: hypothetical protein VM657_02625 [Sphingomonas sp.]|nr:hypothetical protein [Sphingomonas sp.]